MKNAPLNVGVLTPPDSYFKPVLYSHIQATNEFNKLDHDIYISMKNTDTIERHKTPKSVFVTLGLGILALSFPFAKKILKR